MMPGTYSVATALPGALRPVMVSNSRSCASGGSIEGEVVEKPCPDRHYVGQQAPAPVGVNRGQIDAAVDQFDEEVDPDRPHQRLGERIVDDRAVLPAGQRPGRGHHGGGGSDAGRQVPGVGVGALHRVPPRTALT